MRACASTHNNYNYNSQLRFQSRCALSALDGQRQRDSLRSRPCAAETSGRRHSPRRGSLIGTVRTRAPVRKRALSGRAGMGISRHAVPVSPVVPSRPPAPAASQQFSSDRRSPAR